MNYKSIIDLMDLKSMNLRRMDVCIKVMQRVAAKAYAFDIETWQQGGSNRLTEKGLHKCGSSACFGGWLAVSPEFRRSGGGVERLGGRPIFNGFGGSSAVSEYLTISYRAACLITSENYPELYQDLKRKITARNVLARLKYARKVAVKQKSNNSKGE